MFFDTYTEYINGTESPTTYHRWSIVTAAATALGRKVTIPFGHFNLHPNMYTLLVGTPGSRKSSAIKIASNILKQSGYTRFAADRSSKEQFIMDLAKADGIVKIATKVQGRKPKVRGKKPPAINEDDLKSLLGNIVLKAPKAISHELFINADELVDFLGMGNHDFLNMLGVLWDCNDEYINRVKTSVSSTIHRPFVSILGGITLDTFAAALPPEVAGQGFLSRLILVHSEPSTELVAWPTKPNDSVEGGLLEVFKELMLMTGSTEHTNSAKALLSEIYYNYKGVADGRFEHYNSRRHTHLLKLATTLAALEGTLTVDELHVRNAHTMLFYSEVQMPKALSGFGKSKTASVQGSILQALSKAVVAMSFQDLWKIVCQDLAKPEELADVIRNLVSSEKITAIEVGGASKYILTRVDTSKLWNAELGNPKFLTKEERGYKL